MILLPDKHTDIRLSVFVVSAKIVSILKSNGIAKYQDVLDQLTEQINEDVKYVYPHSIFFLYTLSKLKYHSDIDSVELV